MLTGDLFPRNSKQTTGVTAITAGLGGTIKLTTDATIQACCANCYATAGCNGWAYIPLGLLNVCQLALNGAPQSGTKSTQCPSGHGGFTLTTGGAIGFAGGPGQCST